MKKILNMVLLAVFALATIACDTDNITETYRDLNAANLSLSGAKSISYTLGLDESSASFSLDRVQINRPVGTGDLSITLVASVSGKGNVTVDPVSFVDGQTQTSPSMSISNLGLGESCKVVISLPETNTDATIGGKSTSFTVTITREKPASWVSVETKSKIANGLLGLFTAASPTGAYAAYNIYSVKVEKKSDADIFRIKNVCAKGTWPLMDLNDDATTMEGDFYMVIDATDPKSVKVEKFNLGVDWGYGDMYAGTFDAFGYPNDPKGTYDASNGIIKFPKETMGFTCPGYNAEGLYYTHGTTIWLDENKMGADFTRDYTFSQYIEKATVLCSSTKESYESPIYVGTPNNNELKDDLKEKYGTVYCIPSYFADNYNIFFGVNDKGKFVIPEEYAKQRLGIELLAGVEIFMSISKSSAMENGIIYLAYDIVKEDGTIIGSYTDRFYMLDYEADLKTSVGKYTAKIEGVATNIEITDNTEDEALLISGALDSLTVPFNYDGTFKTLYCVNEAGNYYSLTYDGASGRIYSNSYHTLAKTLTGAVVVIPTADGYEYDLLMGFFVSTASGYTGEGKQTLSHEDLIFVPETATTTQEIVLKTNAKLEDYKGQSKSNITIAGQKASLINKKAPAPIGKLDLSKAVKR